MLRPSGVFYDEADKSAILTLNPNFPGNYEGAKPTIAKVIYKKVVFPLPSSTI